MKWATVTGSLERSQGEKATKVQLIALVFALTLCACTRTQTTLSGAAAGTRQGLPSLVFDAPWYWLAAGWRDLWTAPLISIGYGVLFALIALGT